MVPEPSFQNAVFGGGAPKTSTIKTSERTCGLAVKHYCSGCRHIRKELRGARCRLGGFPLIKHGIILLTLFSESLALASEDTDSARALFKEAR